MIGEVTARCCADEDDESALQVIDGWAHARVEVAAVCNIGSKAASKQMGIAKALRDTLPRTAALFEAGAISARVIDAITWRTRLVTDPDAAVLIDAAIAGEANNYGTRSEERLTAAVDAWVEKFDPAAVVRSRQAAEDCYVEFDDKDDPNGVTSFWGRLRITDKMVLQQRLDDLAATVCRDDPRTVRVRRADALGSLAVVGPHLQRLTCQCGNPDCSGAGADRPSAKLATFVRLRAMVCMFPGCDRPAGECDLDHLVPWPAGATHPGNLAPLRREHHLMKTFCGWAPAAHPDGAITWTAPTGHRYVKKPGAAILFPHNDFNTPIPPRRAITLLDEDHRGTMMPRRQRTRAQDRDQRITAERARNELDIALEQADLEANPPPF